MKQEKHTRKKQEKKEIKDKKMNGSRTYGRWHRFLARFFLWLFRVRVHHVEREPEGEHYLLCCNHLSALDPILLAASLQKQQPHFMGKKELFRIPVLSSIIRAFGAYPVDRAGDVGAIKTSISLLSAGQCVGIFPQGTRCAGKPLRDTMEQVKPGAGLLCDKTKVCVLPACLKTKKDRLRPFGGVDLIFGEPIPYAQLEAEIEASGETPTTHQAKYAAVTRQIFERICLLYEEELNDGK